MAKSVTKINKMANVYTSDDVFATPILNKKKQSCWSDFIFFVVNMDRQLSVLTVIKGLLIFFFWKIFFIVVVHTGTPPLLSLSQMQFSVMRLVWCCVIGCFKPSNYFSTFIHTIKTFQKYNIFCCISRCLLFD